MLPVPVRFLGYSRLGALVVVCLAAACFGPFGGGPLTVRLTGDAQQNTAHNRANSVVVRIYQLSASDKFEGASAAALWRDEKGALGEALLGTQELTLLPDGRETVQLKLDKRTRFVGVAADFISPDAQAWRRVFPVATVKTNEIAIGVGPRQLLVKER